MVPDLINATFEFGSGVAVWSNVRALLRHSAVMGIDPKVIALFQAWGLWNLYYYPSLGQWASFYGGLMITAANGTWLLLYVRILLRIRYS